MPVKFTNYEFIECHVCSSKKNLRIRVGRGMYYCESCYRYMMFDNRLAFIGMCNKIGVSIIAGD